MSPTSPLPPVAIIATIQPSPQPHKPTLRRTIRVGKLRHVSNKFESRNLQCQTRTQTIAAASQSVPSLIPQVIQPVKTPIDHWATSAQSALWEISGDYDHDSPSKSIAVETSAEDETESENEAVIGTAERIVRGRARVVEIKGTPSSSPRGGDRKSRGSSVAASTDETSDSEGSAADSSA